MIRFPSLMPHAAPPRLAGEGDAPPFSGEPARLVPGTDEYRKASAALFLAGYGTFALLYCVQPLLPAFAAAYAINAAQSSMALSLATATLAISILISGKLVHHASRRRMMFAGMMLGGVFNILAAASPSWSMLLAARLIEGAVLGAVPAVAVAWLAEEVHPRHLGKAIGLYVGGTAFGGMMGRVAMGLLLDAHGWRVAMALMGLSGIVAAIGFLRLLPATSPFAAATKESATGERPAAPEPAGDIGLVPLLAIGFLLTSIFVTLFNYAGFRLSEAPFHLGPAQISLIFLSYVTGMFASPFAGKLVDRFGPRLPLATSFAVMGAGVLVTTSQTLGFVIAGIILVTSGFFAAHAISSSWIGNLGRRGKTNASARYLLCYYLGSSITGSAGGWVWLHLGWSGVVTLTASLALAGLAISLGLPAGQRRVKSAHRSAGSNVDGTTNDAQAKGSAHG